MTRRIMVVIGLVACGWQAPRPGSSSRVLVVRVRSIGPFTDPDGYTLRVDGVAVLEGRWDGGPRRIGLLEAARIVELGDLAERCEVVEGPAAILLPAGPGREIGVTWRVRCGQAAATVNMIEAAPRSSRRWPPESREVGWVAEAPDRFPRPCAGPADDP